MRHLPSIMKYALVIVIAATAFMAIGFTGSMLFNIHNTGRGGNWSAQAYSDQACTVPLGTLDWGVPEPGTTYTRLFYAKNTGDYDIRLVLSLTNWNPAGAQGYTTVSWDYEGQVLTQGQAMSITLSLVVSESSPFSFDIAAGWEKP